ncbi:MAG: TetR family transcriptional regulator [Ramlibacter sp.]|nr:TetR family transcriptional regulator [Ramlibacter sp.]
MPYPKDHKQRTRQAIVESACRLFRARGFEATSIEDIMVGCALTRGAFYAHFRSKAQLYQESMGHSAPQGGPWLDQLLAGPAGGEGPATPWSFLATDVASKQPEVRRAYAQALLHLREQLQRQVDPARDSDSAALASAAMIVGALAIGMSVDDPALRDSLADACRARARQLLEAQPEDKGGAEPSFFWSVATA